VDLEDFEKSEDFENFEDFENSVHVEDYRGR
jgi:hypothetical protein